MDFPSSYDHHHHHRRDHRYIPPPPLPPPPPHSFSNNHHLPPPSLPPPPPYRSLPPPPPYNPNQSHFTFLNSHSQSIDRDSPKSASYFNHNRQFSPPPPHPHPHPSRFSNRASLDDDINNTHRVLPRQLSDYRPTSWNDSPRVPPPELVRDEYRRVSPYRPTNPHTDELERMSTVFRDGFIDGYSRDRDRDRDRDNSGSNRISMNRQVVRGEDYDERTSYRPRQRSSPDRYVPESKRLIRDVEYGFDSFTSSSSLKTAEDFGGSRKSGYSPEKERSWNRGDEDRRWYREVRDSMKNDDFGRRDEMPLALDREEVRLYESGKFNGKSRVGSEEYNQSSPMKQVQKKSVLLRIGEPNSSNRNRNHDHHFSKASFDNMDGSSFRGKDKERESVLNLNRRLEEERVGSPVELDVTFKSNALVAKAIATPSSPAVGSSYVTPPRNKKIRRSTGSDSPLTRGSKLSAKSESSSRGTACPSSSEKTLKKLEKKVPACGVESSMDVDLLCCSTGNNDLTRNIIFESPSSSDVVRDQGGNGAISDKPLSDLRKKRKRALLLAADTPIQQSANKESEPVKHKSSALDGNAMHINGDDCECSPFKLDEGTMQGVQFPSLKCSVNEMDKSSQTIVRGKDGTDIDTGSPCGFDAERRNILSQDLDNQINSLLNGNDLIPENTDLLAPDFQIDSNSEPNLSQLKSGSVACNVGIVEDDNMQPSQNGAPLLHETDNANVFPESMISLGGNDNIAVLPNQEDILIHQNSLGSYTVVHSTSNVPSTSLLKESGTTVVIDSGDSKNSCLNDLVTLPSDNVAVEGTLPVSENADDMKAQEAVSDVDSCKQVYNTTSNSNSGLTNSLAKNTSETCIVGDTIKKPCFNEAPKPLEKEPLELSTFPMVLVGDSPSISSSKDYSFNTNCETSGLDLMLGLSSTRISEPPGNTIRPTRATDMSFSCSEEDNSFAEDRVSGSRGRHATDSHAEEEHDSRCTETDNLILPSTIERSPDLTIPRRFIESEMLVEGRKGNADDSDLSATKASEEYGPDTSINMATPESLAVSGSSMLNNKSLDCVTSAQKLSKDDNELDEKLVPGGKTVLPSPSISANRLKSNMKSTQTKVTDVSATKKIAVSASQATYITTQSLNSGRGGSNVVRNQPTVASSVTKGSVGRPPSAFANSRLSSPAIPITKPRTWHRTNSTSVSLVPAKKSSPVAVPIPPKKVATVQSSSYVRSGNTLVRKPASVMATTTNSMPALSTSVYRLNHSDTDETKKNTGYGSKVNVFGATSSLNTGILTPIDRPKTPPLLHSTRLSDCNPINAGVVSSSPLECPLVKESETTVNPVKYKEHLPVLEAPEDNLQSSGFPAQSGPASKSESQNTQDEGNLGKKMRYVKRKSNQLVATSTFGEHSVSDVDKNQDGYYKRRKNQLIRTSAGSQVMQGAAFHDDSLHSEMQRVSEVNSSRSFIKKQSIKGKAKMYKQSRFCSVWTLNNQSSMKHGMSLQRQKVWPRLIPWKRAKDWKSFLQLSASIPNNSSLSSVSRKLLLSRKRDTIYTRSPHGFSLRMSKLLSIGGASLKWSKSIEKNAKKANEEATIAVAAAEKEKREKKGTTHSIAGSKSRNNISRERIFRIGLVRYKMDASQRTLQRISDEEPSTSLQSEKPGKRSYVPKRLLIGHEEYVRIGNGNQLVRDPKKRARIFASEKVRWSLHTARLRLAKKRKYCQFFTRFGKCNKNDGKCPYIHDPSKIAVCTKFLNGSCSDKSCKLTHEVIPERMQDCSYFLQGLCSNEHCPYRHVNVNTNASPCEGFLKGYCADGNECRKKHTYACPSFEATGICPQGLTCKLHHRKNRSRGVKRKQQSMEQEQQQQKKNARGRYFGSKKNNRVVTDQVVASSGGDQASKTREDHDIFYQEGKFSDYISLGFSDGEEETSGSFDLTSNQRLTTYTSDRPDSCIADIGELIKPIGIMNKNPVRKSILAFLGPSDRSASLVSEESDVCT